jgi:hypothetical protein
MSASDRRSFLHTGAKVAGAAAALSLLPASAAAAAKEKAKDKTVVGACGLSCTACPLMKENKCKGCAPANKASEEMVKMKNCPVLTCANMKKIDFCGTGCKGFTKCAKMIDHPYSKNYLEKIAGKLAPKPAAV